MDTIRRRRRQLVLLGALAALASLSSVSAADESYPNRAITLVVPLSPGITLDAVARLYADKLGKVLGQPVVVVNRPGAGGLIGTQSVATAAADGYTLLLTNTGHVILPALNKGLPFDPVKDFRGVTLLADAPAVVIVSPTLGVRTLGEFVALARAKPGSINYASAGIGTPTHLAGAYFAEQAQVNLTHIPYKLSADIVSDLLGGRVQATFAPPAYLPTFIENGKLIALAVGAEAPIRQPFAAPTARSQGVNYVNSTWYGMLAPARTPAAVLDRLTKAIAQVDTDPDVREKLAQQGLAANSLSLAAFDRFLKAEAERLVPLVKTAHSN